MHFEFLVEDASGKLLLEAIIEKILNPHELEHTCRIISYKGVGRIPRGLGRIDVQKRILLDRLPKLLRGYGKAYQSVENTAVIVVVDLDDRNHTNFKAELFELLARCNPAPTTLFCIAIEEIEAWMLGDNGAIRSAYPRAKQRVLDRYVQDSICGTWELLADAIHKGGSKALKREGWPAPGRAKCEWAKKTGPYFNVDINQSKSFQVFRDRVRHLAGITV